MPIASNLKQIKSEIPNHVCLVAVSKTKPNEAILEAYKNGQRIFGENKVQELSIKQKQLPEDIEWHMIGHLQSNKVKYIAPFVSLIHGVDKEKLLKEINKQAIKNNRIINCLLQVHIAEEDTKFGFDENEIENFFHSDWKNIYPNINIVGLMGMATFTDNKEQIRREFSLLNKLYLKFKSQNSSFNVLSMGMSGDYKIAIEEGSTMIRVGSLLFGERD